MSRSITLNLPGFIYEKIKHRAISETPEDVSRQYIPKGNFLVNLAGFALTEII